MDDRNRIISSTHSRLFTKPFILVIAISMASFLMGQGSNAGTSVYLETIGEPTTLAGIGALIFSLSAALTRILSGALIDNKGRQVIMIIGSLLMLAGSILPLVLNTGVAFIVWRILQGAGFAAVTTSAATAAADVLPISRLGEGIGYYGLGQAVSMSIGPAFALMLISTDPPENFYIGLACCSMLSLCLSMACRYEKDPSNLPETSEYRMRFEQNADVDKPFAGDHSIPEDEDSENSYNEAPKDKGSSSDKKNISLHALIDSAFEPKALPGTIPMMMIAVSFGFGIFFVGLYGSTIHVSNAGLFFTFAAISMIAIRLLSGKFMDRIAPIKIMGVAVISDLIAFGLLFLCSHVTDRTLIDSLFYISGLFYGISLGISLPINQTIAVKLSPADRWGAANGVYLLGNDLSIGLSSLAWGFTGNAMGFDITILIVMGFIALSFFFALICYPKQDV